MQTVSDVMTRDPVAVRSDGTVRDAIVALQRAGVRHLPVVDGSRLVGMVSDRDLHPWCSEFVALVDQAKADAARELLTAPVSGMMRTDVIALEPGRPVPDVVDAMVEFHIGAVPVVEDDHLVGIVSYIDLIRLLKTNLLLEAEAVGK